MKTFLVFVISLLSVFLSPTSTASEIKFAHVTLMLLSDSEKIIDTKLVIEIGKTATVQMQKKNAAGLATTYRADFVIEKTMVHESGNAVAVSSICLFKLDNNTNQWVMEREQKIIARLNGSTAKTSLHSSPNGAPQTDTFLSISPITEAEVHAKYSRKSAQNNSNSETTKPDKSL
jgi:hypothetical protein